MPTHDTTTDASADFAALLERIQQHDNTADALTLLHIGDTETRIANRAAPDAPLQTGVLPIGVAHIARSAFRGELPTAIRLEEAIQEVEDALAPARQRLVLSGSRLYAAAADLLAVARFAGHVDQPPLRLERAAVEICYDRLAAVAEGRPAASEGLPQGLAGARFAATLLVLREFLHHMDFAAVDLVA